MVTQDLHTFLDEYRASYPADVLEVKDAVSADQDITAFVWELARAGRDPLLWFTNVEDLPVDVVTNVFASRRRLAAILDTTPRQLHTTFQARARDLRRPNELDDGPILHDVRDGDDVDLATLPLLRHFDTDAAPYITSGIIVAEDPVTGVTNMSYHRAKQHARSELATSLHSRGDVWRSLHAAAEQGRSLPVAMVLGGHPLFMLAAAARVPHTVDEQEVAGGLFRASLDVVRTPLHGLRVPATADFVLEGSIDPRQTAEEGPFGEFSGYSSDRSTNTLLQVEAVMQRPDPLLLDVAGGDSAEHLTLGRLPREAEMAEKLKERFPAVSAVHYPNSGTHFHCYLALRQRREGEARQIMLALLGWDPYVKTVVALDDDIDIEDDAKVLWAIATQFQPATDLFVVDGLPGSPLDPSSSPGGTTSRMAVDATRGPGFEASRIAIAPRAVQHARAILGFGDDDTT